MELSSTISQQAQDIDKLNKRLSKRPKSIERRRPAEEFAIDTWDEPSELGNDDWWTWQDDEPPNVPVAAAAVTVTRTKPTRMSVARSSQDGNGDPDDNGDGDSDKARSKKDKKEKG